MGAYALMQENSKLLKKYFKNNSNVGYQIKVIYN